MTVLIVDFGKAQKTDVEPASKHPGRPHFRKRVRRAQVGKNAQDQADEYFQDLDEGFTFDCE